MAKFLHYRRHSTKDGAMKDTIGPLGLLLAFCEGQKAAQTMYSFEGIEDAHMVDGPRKLRTRFIHAFHGPLIRTLQTLYAFTSGLGYSVPLMPAVEEIGTNELFAEFATPKFRESVARGASNFEAILATYGEKDATRLTARFTQGVQIMFAQMSHGETGIAFGHSPCIELVAWAIGGFCTLPDELSKLNDMEGIVLQMADDGTITITEKISVEK